MEFSRILEKYKKHHKLTKKPPKILQNCRKLEKALKILQNFKTISKLFPNSI